MGGAGMSQAVPRQARYDCTTIPVSPSHRNVIASVWLSDPSLMMAGIVGKRSIALASSIWEPLVQHHDSWCWVHSDSQWEWN